MLSTPWPGLDQVDELGRPDEHRSAVMTRLALVDVLTEVLAHVAEAPADDSSLMPASSSA